MPFKIGQRVKHSGPVIQRARDYWNNQGREPQKSGARKALDEAVAQRGTITALLPGDGARGVSPGLQITWDNGSLSNCLSYRVEAV